MSPGCSDISRRGAARVKPGECPETAGRDQAALGVPSAHFFPLQRRLGCQKNVTTDEEREMRAQPLETGNGVSVEKPGEWGNILQNGF